MAAAALAGYLQTADEFNDQTKVVLLCGAKFDKAKIFAALTR